MRIVVSFGGGTNSTAMPIGMHERGIRPDLILFADTGGEHPRTMRHLFEVQAWTERVGFPSIQVVRWNHWPSLEENLLRKRELPSPAYGAGRGCSVKFKRQPLDRYARDWSESTGIAQDQVRRAIGYGVDELRRASGKVGFGVAWYPMIEWRWGRHECIDAIERAGLEQPGKSACFFCPSASSHGARDVLRLARDYPELLRRAIAIERNAVTRSVRGLGMTWAWGDLFDEGLRPKQLSLPMLSCPIEEPCDCFDGEDD